MKSNTENSIFWISFSVLVLALFFILLLVIFTLCTKLPDFKVKMAQVKSTATKPIVINMNEQNNVENFNIHIVDNNITNNDNNATYANDNVNLKVVANLSILLKNEKKAKFDLKTGFLSLDMKDFFVQNSSEIKDKATLQHILNTYFDVLLNEKIVKNINQIFIDIQSDNTYHKALVAAMATNLEDFIFSFYDKKEDLKKYLSITTSNGGKNLIFVSFSSIKDLQSE